MLFEKDYNFRGAHADKVKHLSDNKFDKEHTLFERFMDVYLMAPIVGFLQGRRAPLDKTTQTTATIFAGTLNNYRNDMLFSYRLIMLLDTEYEKDPNERINKAFRDYNDDVKTKNDLERFEEYVRGGVDYLYEKLCKDATHAEDYINNVYELISDFYERYGDLNKKIMQLCEIARD